MYDDEEAQSAPSNIIPAIKRYKWHLIIAAPALLIGLTLFVIALPPVYRSTGVVMVETQQIPMDLVQSTVTAAASEQIDVIRQRVMTRDNLIGIIKKYPYFNSADATPLELSQILNTFRNNIKLEVASAKNGRQTVAIGFEVSFASKSPAISQAVTNDLVSLFLSENVKARTARASETTEFLRSEAEKIRRELDEIESTVADFKRSNKDALPEHLTLYTNMREDLRKRISEIDQNISYYNEQINLQNAQLALARQQNTGIVGSNDELQLLRNQYRALLIRYKPQHPDVKTVKEQIEILEGGLSDGNDEAIYSSAELDMRNQISSLRAKIDHLEAERGQEYEKLEDIQQRIIKIPQVERGFVSIKRDYDAKQNQYENIIGKMQNAEMAESLEQQRKAERFTLLEPPIIPRAPSEPDRKKLLALTGAFSFGFPIGIVFMLGFLDKSIRSGEAIEQVFNALPLVEIPYLETESEKKKNRRKLIAISASVFLFAVITVLLVHFLFMPLDQLLYKIASRV